MTRGHPIGLKLLCIEDHQMIWMNRKECVERLDFLDDRSYYNSCKCEDRLYTFILFEYGFMEKSRKRTSESPSQDKYIY